MRVPLVITAGINLDDTVFSTGAGAWADVDKVRFWRGKPQVIGGWERFSGDILMGPCRGIYSYTDNTGNLIVGYGSYLGLEVSYGGGLYNITPASFVEGNPDGTGGQGYGTGTYSTGLYSEPSTVDYFPMTWSLSSYGSDLIANPRGQTIYTWPLDTGVPAIELANAPEEVTYTLVVPQRQVMAFGCNEETSGDFNPLCIRFSDIENPTDWTTTPTNNAGEVILEGGGRIVGARLIGDLVYVWTDSNLFRGQFIGSPDQTWRFDRVGEHCGLIGPNAAVVVSQVAYWMSTDVQFYQCALGGAPQLIPSPVQADVKASLTAVQQDKVYASSCAEFGEVRWDFPDSGGTIVEGFDLLVDAVTTLDDGDGNQLQVTPDIVNGTENNRYVAACTLDGSWSRGNLSRTAMIDAGPGAYPIGTDYLGFIYLHERGQSADGNVLDWSMETADQYISDASQFLMLKGIWPDFEGQVGPVNLTVITRKYPQATEVEHGPYVLTPGRPKKDFRATGRVARIKLSASSSPSFVRVGKPEFEAEGAGFQ